MDEKMGISDLITIAIFTVILFIVMFTFGMLGYIPILMFGLPVILSIICGIPFMLFLTKANKFGMVTILSLLIGLIFFGTGHTGVPIISFTICGFIADLILRKGNYTSVKNTYFAYATYCLGVMGNMIPMFIMKDYYFSMMSSQMGKEYTDIVMLYVTNESFFVLLIATFIAGLIGAYIGRLLLKKHFEKAGIV